MGGYCLHNIPADIYRFILEEQNRLKLERGTNKFSFATTIYKLLREHKKFLEQEKKLNNTELKNEGE